MKRTLFILSSVLCLLSSAPAAEWLTPQRSAALKRVSARPYIIHQERLEANTMVYTWTNSPTSVTTQKVQRVLGKPAKNAWRDKLDAKDAEKKAILDEVKAASAKPTKKNLDDILNKHSGR